MFLNSNHNGSLFDDVKAGAENGAAIGRWLTSIAGAAAGGLVGAAMGCFRWFAAKPLVKWKMLKEPDSFEGEG